MKFQADVIRYEIIDFSPAISIVEGNRRSIRFQTDRQNVVASRERAPAPVISALPGHRRQYLDVMMLAARCQVQTTHVERHQRDRRRADTSMFFVKGHLTCSLHIYALLIPSRAARRKSNFLLLRATRTRKNELDIPTDVTLAG